MIPDPIGLSMAAAAFAVCLINRNAAPFVFLACLVFGSTEVFSVTAIGGAPITVPQFGLLTAVVFLLVRRNVLQRLLTVVTKEPSAQLLVAFSVYAVAGAILFPRMFQGDTEVYTLARIGGASSFTVPLQASSGNITQSLYLIASLGAFLVVRLSVVTVKDFNKFVAAVGLYVLLHVAFGLVDLVGKYVFRSDVLEFLRTADYVMLTDTGIMGFYRLVGTYPEASAFAFASAGPLAFTFALWQALPRQRLWLIMFVVLTVLLALSTSSTGYVFLGFASIAVVLLVFRQIARGALDMGTVWVIAIFALGLVAVTGLTITNPQFLQPLFDLVDESVLRKAGSNSAIERFTWNRQGMTNLVDTAGLGIGLGSSRTSSWPIALISQTGVIGALLYFCFLFMALGQSQTPSGPTYLYKILNACRAYAIACLIAASISGALFDLGIAFYVVVALGSSAKILLREQRVSPSYGSRPAFV